MKIKDQGCERDGEFLLVWPIIKSQIERREHKNN